MAAQEAARLLKENADMSSAYSAAHPQRPSEKPSLPPRELTDRLHRVPNILLADSSVLLTVNIQPPLAFFDDAVGAECLQVEQTVRQLLVASAKLRSVAVAARQEGITLPPEWLAQYEKAQQADIADLVRGPAQPDGPAANAELQRAAEKALKALTASPKPGTTMPASRPAAVAVVAKYTGRIGTMSFDDSGKMVVLDTPIVIRDANEYGAFIGRIPTREISMTNPSPPSDDPLLKKPPIDFQKHIMVAVIRAESMYLPPDIASVAVADGKLVVEFVVRELGDYRNLNQAGGIGTYCAAVVPRHDGAVKFVRQRVPPATQPEEGTGP
jgi:plasmid stabilization system protein ParE